MNDTQTPRTKAKIKENLGLLMDFLRKKYGNTDEEVEQMLFNALDWTASDVQAEELQLRAVPEAEPLRTCNCGSPTEPHCESVHVAAPAPKPAPPAPKPSDIEVICPLPWTANCFLITDADGRQVLHVGGSRDEYGRGMEGGKLEKLVAFIVEAVNVRRAAERKPPR